MIVVFGGTGFLGSALVRRLREQDHEVASVGRSQVDILELGRVRSFLFNAKPSVVYHLAGLVGGIGANRKTPADFWRDNLRMGLNVLDACHAAEVPKLVLVGTTCSYPRVPPVTPFREDDIFSGYPEPTNAPYAMAKSCLMVGSWAYRQQYGVKIANVIPTNLYGPKDNFDLESSHVVPAMIRKFHEAKASGGPVKLWGTGSPTRDLLYVDDAADALVLARNLLSDGEPVNVGSGREVSIRELASEVARAVGYTGPVEWDTSKPDGQPRRCLDISRARGTLGWTPRIDLREGLGRTYSWFTSRAELGGGLEPCASSPSSRPPT